MKKLKNDKSVTFGDEEEDRGTTTNGDDEIEVSENETEDAFGEDDMEGMIVVDEVSDVTNSNEDVEEDETSEENKRESPNRQSLDCSKLSSEENEKCIESGPNDNKEKSKHSSDERMLEGVSSDKENEEIFGTVEGDKTESLKREGNESSEQTLEDCKDSEKEKAKSNDPKYENILELTNSNDNDQKEESIKTLEKDGKQNEIKMEIPKISELSSESAVECSNGIGNVEEKNSKVEESLCEDSKDTNISKKLSSHERDSNKDIVKSIARDPKRKPSKKKDHGCSELSIKLNKHCSKNSSNSLEKDGSEDSVDKSAPEIVSSVEKDKNEEIFKDSKQDKKRESSSKKKPKSYNSLSKKVENCSKHYEDESSCTPTENEMKSDNSEIAKDENLLTTSSVAEKNRNNLPPNSSEDPKNPLLHWNPRVYLPRLCIEAFISSTPAIKVNISDSFLKKSENSNKDCKNKYDSEKKEESNQDLGSSKNENTHPVVSLPEKDKKKSEKNDSCTSVTKKSRDSFDHSRRGSSYTESDKSKNSEDSKDEHNLKVSSKKKISKDHRNEDKTEGRKDKSEDLGNSKDKGESIMPSLKKSKNSSELVKIEGENNPEEKKEDSEDIRVKNLISNFKIPLRKNKKAEKNDDSEKNTDNFRLLLNEKSSEYDKHGGNNYKRRREENENSKYSNARLNPSQSLEIREKSSEDSKNRNRYDGRNLKNEDSRNLKDKNHFSASSFKERERGTTDNKNERDDSKNSRHGNHLSVPLLPKREESLGDLRDGRFGSRRNYDSNDVTNSKNKDDSFVSFVRKRKDSFENSKHEYCSEEKRKREDSKDLKRKKLYEKLPLLEEYWKTVEQDPTNFISWTDLLRYVDLANNVEAACEAYDDFLSRYPYCYGYWRKYADFLKNRREKEDCEKIFEKGIRATPLSVDLWLHYLEYGRDAFSENENRLRELFEKSLSACGLEFRSDKLWETYVRWETSLGNLVNVTKIFDRWLGVPTRGYITVLDKFREHVEKNSLDEILDAKEYFSLRNEVLNEIRSSEAVTESKLSTGNLMKVNEMLKEKIINIRREHHRRTQKEALARWSYEENIKRPYFHVKPLEQSQLDNWSQYLDFEIKEGDQTRVIVLFERCLIACASYEAFWIQFADYLLSLPEVDIERVRGVFTRACNIHHPKKLKIHLKWAQFEEAHGDSLRATSILDKMEKLCPNVLVLMIRRVNLLRLCGEFDLVCSLYEQYIESTEDKGEIGSDLAIKYARICSQISSNIQNAYDVLEEAIKKDKVESLCPSLSPYFEHRWFYECRFGHYHTIYHNIQAKYWNERNGYESGDFVITDNQPGGPRVSECAKKEMKRVKVEDNSCDINQYLFTTSNQDYRELLPMDNTMSMESSIVNNPVMISESMVSLNKVSPSEEIRLRVPTEKYREQRNMIRPKKTDVLRTSSHFSSSHTKSSRSKSSCSDLLVNDAPHNKYRRLSNLTQKT